MIVRHVLCWLAILSALSAAAEKPSILFILVDDLGYGDLACYGNAVVDTPNIDRLAREGMRFTSGYAAAPICSASRAATLTGKSPARLGFEFVTKNAANYGDDWAARYAGKKLVPPVYTLNLPLEEKTMAEVLGAAGYATGITGKWHVSSHHEHYLGWSPTHGPLQQGFAWGREDYGAHPYGMKKSERGKFGPYGEGEFPRDGLTENAIQFLEDHREEPFFLMVSHYYVHTPLGTRCKWLLEKYRSKVKGKRADYAAFVETMDHYVGQLLDALDALGLAENTLVVLTSDNGGHPQFAFNTPLRGSKWNLYEGGIRVPFMVRWPRVVKADTTCAAPVVGTDLLPTFAAVAGTESGANDLDGTNIIAALQNGRAEALDGRAIGWHFPYYHPEKGYEKCPEKIGVEDGYVSQTRPQSAWREGSHKLLYFHEDGRCELYDLSKDPSEQHDLSAEMPEKTSTMKRALLGYLRDVKARMPQRNAEGSESS